MRYLLIAFICTLLVLNSKAQTCLSGDCTSGFGTYRFSDSSLFIGESLEGRCDGYGVFKSKSGSVYYGEFARDTFSGFGVYYYSNGDVYIGDYKNNNRHGEGTYIFYGIDSILNGVWQDDAFIGLQHFKNSPGCVSGNCYDGYGTYVYKEGDKYTGYFKNFVQNGYGIYYYKNGARYIGEWKDGVQNGFGVYYFKTGEKYIGYWENLRRHGWGINYDPYKELKEIGFWDKDSLVQTFAQAFPKTGCVSGNCKDGFGKFVYSNGFYEGYFKNDLRNGQGTYYFDNGEVYKGNFTNNKFDAQGTYYWVSGGKYAGAWKDHRMHGKGDFFRNTDLVDKGFWYTGVYYGDSLFNYEPIVSKGKFAYTNFEGEKRLALVIGNAKYTGTDLTKLKNPENDATTIAASLAKIGFDTIKVLNGTLTDMRNAVKDFGLRLKSYNVGLFFYAGHGMQVDGENYIVPTNANITEKQDFRYECLSLSDILRKMEDAGCATNIVLLDACRNNPFEQSSSRAFVRIGLAPVRGPVGTFIGYATEPGQTASDGVGDNGLFTSSILKTIDQPNLTIQDAFMKIRADVVKTSARGQIPWEASSLISPFYFIKKN